MLKKLTFLLYLFLVCEMMVQALALMSMIPGGFSKSTHVPYGRVYWTKEGFSNSVMNRYGWYYAEFTPEASAGKRIALVGDSYIEALQVEKKSHMGARLERTLRDAGLAYDVIALGVSGAGVAHYLEMMRYAHEHFRPDEFIVFLYQGNDYRNASLALEGKHPEKYIYYRLSQNGVDLYPGSEHPVERFREKLSENHRPIYVNLPAIVRSHVFFPQIVRDALRLVRQNLGLYADKRAGYQDLGVETEFQAIGLDASIFRVPVPEEAMQAILVNHALLSRCKEFAESVGTKFKVVTIPVFPSKFYLQKGGEPSFVVEGFDFSYPERLLIEYARDADMQVLPMYDFLDSRKEDPEKVRSMYLLDGRGHLSETGHEYFATAIFERFYRQ